MISHPIRRRRSDYMDFAKFDTGAPFNLASSGVLDCDLSVLGLSMYDLALHGPNAGGYDPLTLKISHRFGVDPDVVVTPGGGCSFANHLALAALLDPGDEVLIEDPTYELIGSTLGYLQAQVKTFERSPQTGWRLDADAIATAVTPSTRLVVLTNLHNPSSALADDDAVAHIAGAAAKVGAMVLIDEVYRELMFRTGVVATAFRPDGNIVVTSSLTKAYGLSGLRCGWILAPCAQAQSMRRLNDLYGVHPPHVAERMAVVAFERLPVLRDRANAMIDENRAAYEAILGDHPRLDQHLFDQGTTVFPRLVKGDVDTLHARLMGDFQTSIVPGRFFNRPNHFRIGLGGDPKTTQAGLERLVDALT